MTKLEKCWGVGGIKSLGVRWNWLNLYHTTIFQVCAFTFYTHLLKPLLQIKKKAFKVNAKMKNVGLTKHYKKYRNKRWC